MMPRSGGAFLSLQPWHAVPMRALIMVLCLLTTPALADVAGTAGSLVLRRMDRWGTRAAPAPRSGGAFSYITGNLTYTRCLCSQARCIVPGNRGAGPTDGEAAPWFLMPKR